MRTLFVSFFMIVLSSPILAQSGWNTDLGTTFIKASQWWITTNEHFTDNGRVDPNLTTGLYTSSVYLSTGLSDRWAGMAYLPVFSRAVHNNLRSGTTNELIIPGEAINHVGDPLLGIQYQILRYRRLAWSSGLHFGLPFGKTSGGTLGILQTGDGEFNQLIRTDLGYSFSRGSRSGYLNGYLGFNNRTKGFSDEIWYGFEGGIQVFPDQLLTILRVYGITSLGNGAGDVISDGSSFFSNNSAFLSLSSEINYELSDGFGLSVGLATVLSGRLIFAGTTYNVGFYFRIQEKERGN